MVVFRSVSGARPQEWYGVEIAVLGELSRQAVVRWSLAGYFTVGSVANLLARVAVPQQNYSERLKLSVSFNSLRLLLGAVEEMQCEAYTLGSEALCRLKKFTMLTSIWRKYLSYQRLGIKRPLLRARS